MFFINSQFGISIIIYRWVGRNKISFFFLSHPGFLVGFVLLIFSFMCRSLFFPLYFFFRPLCCLSFFNLRILVTPLVSLKYSSKVLFVKDPIGNKLKGFHGLSLVDNNYQHLIKWHENFNIIKILSFNFRWIRNF